MGLLLQRCSVVLLSLNLFFFILKLGLLGIKVMLKPSRVLCDAGLEVSDDLCSAAGLYLFRCFYAGLRTIGGLQRDAGVPACVRPVIR